MKLEGISSRSRLETLAPSMDDNGVSSSDDFFSEKQLKSVNSEGLRPFKTAMHMENACRSLSDESNSTE